MPDLYSSPETPLQISLQGNCHGYDLSHMLLYYDSRISPGCERQPKWLRQKAMVMTYARCSYLPTDIFPSILARFPQSGYERMRPQSQCASRQDAPQFAMTWQCAPACFLCLGSATIVGILLFYIGFLNVGFGIPFPAAALGAQTYMLKSSMPKIATNMCKH